MESLCSDDIKIIKNQIIFRKPRGEIIEFMVRQFGMEKRAAVAVYEKLAVEVHHDQKRIKYKWGAHGK